MSEGFKFTDSILDMFAPEVLSRLNGDESLSVLGKLCRKHGVSFMALMQVLAEYNTWQSQRDEEEG